MFARTSRLTLRPGWPEDAPEIARAFAGARQDAGTRLPDDAHALLSGARSVTEPLLLIFDRPSSAPRLVGAIGITAAPAIGEHAMDLWLRPEQRGQGYATEAGRAVVAMARHALGLRRLSAGHFADDPASGRLLRRLGFRPAGGAELRPSPGRGGEAAFLPYELSLEEVGSMPLAA